MNSTAWFSTVVDALVAGGVMVMGYVIVLVWDRRNNGDS
jgi:hypothetical protein